jgi:WD40 repeat protein
MSYHKDRVTTIIISPDNEYVITASHDKTIKIWDFNNRKEIRTLYGHEDRVVDLVLTPDGSRILSAAHDKTVKIWDIKTGANLGTFCGHDAGVDCLALTTDGLRVVSISNFHNTTFMIWDLESGRILNSFSTDFDRWINRVLITSDGKRAITASIQDRMVTIWDLNTGERLFNLLNGAGSRKCSLALSHGEHFVVSGGDSNDITLWDIERGVGEFRDEEFKLENVIVDTKVPNYWQNPGWMIYDVAFLNNGLDIMSASGDGMIKIWDLKTRLVKSYINLGKHLTCCTFTPDGRQMVAGDISGQVYFLTEKDFLPVS